jgi:hypothetical protein
VPLLTCVKQATVVVIIVSEELTAENKTEIRQDKFHLHKMFTHAVNHSKGRKSSSFFFVILSHPLTLDK